MFVYREQHICHIPETKGAFQKYFQCKEAGLVSRGYFRLLAVHVGQCALGSMGPLGASGDICCHQNWDGGQGSAGEQRSGRLLKAS